MSELQLEQVNKPCIAYTANSWIPGSDHTVNSNRSFFEKIWWVILVVSSILGCGLLVLDLCRKWSYTPVVIKLSDTATPIWQIPFPAITICPDDKTDANVFNISERGSKYFMKVDDFRVLEDGKL
jgi:acid-sensing ion channel, other